MRVDFTSQVFFRDPAAGIEKLRALGPVVETRFPIVGKVWITYESTTRVLKDSEEFTLRKEGAGLASFVSALANHAVAPLVEVCRRLEHAEVMPIAPAMQPLFRDVTDHVRRVQEEIDALREVLAFAFEASLMRGQAQQTAITRKLAAWAAILAVPTAIAGIYGMNFEFMPELRWSYGYFLVIGVIVAICGTLYWRFRRHGWV